MNEKDITTMIEKKTEKNPRSYSNIIKIVKKEYHATLNNV